MGSTKRIRESSAISVRFRPGADDDIKDWWNNEPDRAYILRLLIRNYIQRGTQLPQNQEKREPERVNIPTVQKTHVAPLEKPKPQLTENNNYDPMSMGVRD